jgi:hypothetical protein
MRVVKVATIIGNGREEIMSGCFLAGWRELDIDQNLSITIASFSY